MKTVKIRITISDDKGNIYDMVEDYSELIDEWITNGSNGTEEDVLSSIKEGLCRVSDLEKENIAFGFVESILQSGEAPAFIYRTPTSELYIKVECLENDYLNGE
jgi:hypothetical protein